MHHQFKCVLSHSLKSKNSFQIKAKMIFLGFLFKKAYLGVSVLIKNDFFLLYFFFFFF